MSKRRNRDAAGRFKSGDAHPKSICLEARRKELEALDIGTLTLRGPVFRADGYLRIRALCSACEIEKAYDVINLLRGRTTTCACLRGRKYWDAVDLRLADRAYAMRDRCENPNSPAFRDYGALGIRFRFASASAFVSYVRNTPELWHKDYIGVQFDRIRNGGDYERGNLRLVSAADNLRNTSRNKYVFYRGQRIVAADLYALLKRDYPEFALSPWTTARLAAKGVSPEEILQRRPRRKRS